MSAVDELDRQGGAFRGSVKGRAFSPSWLYIHAPECEFLSPHPCHHCTAPEGEEADRTC